MEFAGIGPGPFAAMLFSDMGAEIVRVDRKGGRQPSKTEIYTRGRGTVQLDMKKPEAVEAAPEADRSRRRADRGLPPRRDGAASVSVPTSA